jgi:hypothetical protein
MTHLGIKTCGKSEFDTYEAKKRFLDSGKAYIFKRKCDFCLKTNFRVDIQLVLNPRNFINIKFRFPAHFYHKRSRFYAKISFLRLFASVHNTPSLNQGNFFSLRKCQIRIPRMFLPLEWSFPEKNLKIFSRG